MNLTINGTTDVVLHDYRLLVNGIVSDDVMSTWNLISNAILCQAVCIFGTIANIINLIVFVRIGYTDSIYISLTALAICDLGACFILIWNTIAQSPWFQLLDVPFGPYTISYLTSSWPHAILSKLSTYLTAFISFERCLCVTLPLKVKTIITRTRVKIFVFCTFLSGFGKFALLYSTYWYDWRFYPSKNKTLLGLFAVDNIVELESVYHPILFISIPFFCFGVVAVSTVLLIFALRKNSKWKQQVVHIQYSETITDKSKMVSSKEMKIAKMVATLSALYIACYVPLVSLACLTVIDHSLSVNGTNKNLFMMLADVSFLLQSINSASNIIIYHKNSSVYRENFKQMLGCEEKSESN